MSNIIKKKFTTETSHIVRGAVSERCLYNIHGHSYKWFVAIEGNIQDNGMVLDFKELQPIKEFIDLFDHATVFWRKEEQEIIDFFMQKFHRVHIMYKNTTAENMARLVFKFTQDWLDSLPKAASPPYSLNIKPSYVEVWETETGCAIASECDSNDILVKVTT